MSLYPSLEDMKVDQMMKAQLQQHGGGVNPPASSTAGGFKAPTPAGLPYPPSPSAPPPSAAGSTRAVSPAYPGLAEYMGLELTPEEIALNMPEYSANNQQTSLALNNYGQVVGGPASSSLQVVGSPSSSLQVVGSSSSSSLQSLTAPLSGSSLGLARAQVSHGIRQVVLCKDGEGKVGMRVKAINKGIFVCLVTKESPAALGGLRFGDQILQVNNISVAGYSSDKVHDILKKAGNNNIVLAVRDRPFERTLTLHKDSTGHIGFQFKDGRINSIAVESSAARNGLLVDHNLLEVNGQNVVGVKDKEVGRFIEDGGDIVTITIIPTFIYNHIIKNMSNSLLTRMMDHSVPEM